MRHAHKALPIAFISGLLAGCSGSPATSAIGSTPAHAPAPSVLQDMTAGGPPPALRFTAHRGLHGIPAPATAANGIYVTQLVSNTVLGYSSKKRSEKKKGPICTVPWKMVEPQAIAVDSNGNLLEVDSTSFFTPVNVGTGPKMCGALATTIEDQYGYGDYVASRDALNGVVAVANQWDFSNYGFNPGSIAVCTVSAGCTTNLTNSAMNRVAGVAIAPNGDCWASALNASGQATLTYFQGCSGSGQQASGYQNPGYGGLDIDANGNILAMSYVIKSYVSTLYVYSGCNPACTLVGGPFNLLGVTVAGHLNAGSNEFAAADPEYGQVDIYSYSPMRVKYKYSFNKGLSQQDDVGGAAYNPPSPGSKRRGHGVILGR